jgi:hypothetical protein
MEDLDRQVSQLARARRASMDAPSLDNVVPEQTQLWTALVSHWSLANAQACRFPTGSRELSDVIDSMRRADLVNVQGDEFRMNIAGRSKVLKRYLDNPKLVPELLRTLTEIGKRLSEIELGENDEDIRRWAELSAHVTAAPQMVTLFDTHIDEAIKESRPAEALNWIQAARPLAVWLARDMDNSMDVAIQRAGQRVELLTRERSDQRLLQDFFSRGEQIDAVHALVAGPDGHWALHLIGVGGVGKTMLVKYITGKKAKEWKLATARIDFDYLTADYPMLAPGLLLWSFGQQLRAHDETGAATRNFDAADDILRKLHHELRSSADGLPRRGTGDPQFGQALNLFIEALRALPRQVVLIVDTCEELAKVTPDGHAPENVVETFRILRALHDGSAVLEIPSLPPNPGLPSLRVVFSGRRPLARSGAGWQVTSSALDERPYLRLHEIRGFTHEEARRYLTDKARVPEEYVEVIVEKSSPEVARIAGLRLGDERAARDGNQPRCNPFELKLYADWAKEDPRPAPEDLRKANNTQYVEQRIMRRLGFDPPEAVLQAIALLGHFDEQTLRSIAGGENFETVFERLQQQEWIDQRLVTVEEGKSTRIVLSVERGIRHRLLSYFRGHNGLSEISKRAADYLEEITTQTDLSQLDWSHFDGALRVLELDPRPERAEEWWRRVEERMMRQRGFRWMVDVLGFIQGPDGAASLRNQDVDPYAPEESRMRPAVLATWAAALLHGETPALAAQCWDAVAVRCEATPGAEASEAAGPSKPSTTRRAHVRAIAGRVAATRFTRRLPPQEQVQALVDLVEHPALEPDSQLAAALVAAVEQLVEFAERKELDISSSRLALSPARFVDLVARVGDADLTAFACALAGRVFALTSDWPAAEHWLERAVDASARASAPPRVWLDWLPPDNIQARLLVEFASALWPARLDAAAALRMVGGEDSLGSAEDADDDRLNSIRLSLILAIRPIAPDEDKRIKALVRDKGSGAIEKCNVHRVIPPLRVAALEALAVDFTPSALHTLRQLARRRDLTGRHGARALARVAPRMRVLDEKLNVDLLAALEDRKLVWLLNALQASEQGAVPALDETSDPAAWIHVLWQTAAPDRAAQVVDIVRARTDLYSDERLALDLREMSKLDSTIPAPPFDAIAWVREHGDQPAAALRLLLRAAPPDTQGPVAAELLGRLGCRRAAEIALGEADLLTLRTPEASARIYATALAWFSQCNDDAGQVIAATAMSLAQGRAGRDENLSAAGERLENAYVALRRHAASGLPEFAAIRTAALAGDLDLRVAEEHQPWVARIACAILIGRQAANRQDVIDVSKLRGKLLDWIGAYGQDGKRLPLDVQGCFVERRGTMQLTIADPQATWWALARWWTQIGVGLAMLIGGLAGAGYLLKLMVDAAPSMIDLVSSNPEVELGVIICATYACLIAAAAVFLRLAPRRFIELRITTSTAAAGPAAAALTAAIFQSLSNPRVVFSTFFSGKREWLRSLGRAELPAVEHNHEIVGPLETRVPAGRYAASPTLLPPEFLEQYKRMSRRLPFASPPDVVIVPATGSLSGAPWEAMIARDVAGSTVSPANLPFRFRRVVEARIAREHVAAKPIRAASCRSSDADESASKLGLAPLAGDSKFKLVEWSEDPTELPSAEDIHILHLMGISENIGAGASFRFGRTVSNEATISLDESKPSQTSLGAADLVRAFPNLRVCILQGEVDPLRGERTGSDRGQAALARAFAAEVFALGIPIVIMLPRLDGRRAAEALEAVATTLASRPRRGTAALQKALVRAQERILSGYAEASETGWELAMDVCLYAVPGWSGKWR